MSIQSQNEAEIRHILGIDFGTAKVGLAMADSELKIASAYKTLENNKDLLDNLAEIIRANEIDMIIFGTTEYNGQADDKMKFGKQIEQKLGIKVEYQSEMFTTKMAENNLIERGLKNVKRFDDQEAARIILQEWLDKKFGA